MRRLTSGRLLSRLAHAVGDRTPVDWEALRAKDGTLPRHLENLRSIERMTHLEESPDETRTPSSAPTKSGSVAPNDDASPRRAPEPSECLFTWGRLRALEKIGEGGFSEVYRAYDVNLQIEVALKLRHANATQDPRAVDQFTREARILAQIRHPHIVHVYGVEVHDGRVGVWMDLVRGKTFAQRVREGGPCSAKEAAGYGVDLCCAVASLHAANLTHRDLKPSNVMREDNGGNIFLLDLGSAGDLALDQQWKLADRFAGTPLAAPPEVLVHRLEPQRTADIYGLGIVLYWLVTGRYPVEGETVEALREKHRHGQVVPLFERRSDLPEGFCNVIDRALSPDPRDRFASVSEMHHALTLALGTIDTAPLPSPKPKRNPLRFVAAAAGGLAMVALIAVKMFAPFDVRASVFRVRNGLTEPLTAGGTIAPGDSLFVEIEGSKDINAYVFAQDDAQETAQALYPLAARDDDGRLAARQRHHVPRGAQGQNMAWPVSNANATAQTILIVAAETRIAPADSVIAALAATTPTHASAGSTPAGEVAALPPSALAGMRGFDAPVPLPAPRGLRHIGALKRSLAQRTDVRIFEFDLRYRSR